MDERGVRLGPLFLGASALLSIALLAGRAAGFAREVVLASTLGVSGQADVAVLLLTLPDLLVNLLLSGGLSVALIPVFKRVTGPERVALFVQASLAVAALFGALALSIALVPAWWLHLMAPGLGVPDALLPSGFAFLAIALAVPLTALAGVSTAWLNARNRFFVAGCGTLIFNACVVVALLMWRDSPSLLGVLAVAILIGAAARWTSQLMALPGTGLNSFFGVGWMLTPALLRSFGQALLATSLLVLVPVIVRALASWLGAGGIAAFNYATKLVELPVGVLIATLATVAYPRLSELHAAGDSAQAHQELARRLRRALALAWAVLLTGLWFSDAVVTLLFARGKVSSEAASQIAMLTRVLLLSVPFVGVSGLAAAWLNAQGRTGVVLWLTLVCLPVLPLLGAIALALDSPGGLMGAVVGFQVAYALVLVRAGRVDWVGPRGWLDAKMLRCIGLTTVIVLLGVGLDASLGRLGGGSGLFAGGLQRSLLALCVFAVAAYAGLRCLAGEAPGSRGAR